MDTRAPLRRRAWRESDWAKAELVVFDHLVAVARAGDRCPDNGAIRAMLKERGLPLTGQHGELYTTLLARHGKIEAEVAGKNWRTVRILEGDAAGRTSRPEPHGYDPYLIIGKTNRYPRKQQ